MEDPAASRHFRSRLLQAKEARKLVEQDALLLANRIALLKLEEEKAWKKIQHTKTRADEILRLRKENEERMEERRREEAARRAAEEEAKKRTHDSVAASTTRGADPVRGAPAGVRAADRKAATERASSVRRLKEEKLHIKHEIDRARAEEVERARKMKEQIKAAQEEARKKREAAEREAARRRREEYEKRVAEEEVARKRTEDQVMRLERLEMELIERLRNTQMMQQAAYSDLESALGGTAAMAAGISPTTLRTSRGESSRSPTGSGGSPSGFRGGGAAGGGGGGHRAEDASEEVGPAGSGAARRGGGSAAGGRGAGRSALADAGRSSLESRGSRDFGRRGADEFDDAAAADAGGRSRRSEASGGYSTPGR